MFTMEVGGTLILSFMRRRKKGVPLEALAFVDHSVDGFTLISSMICLLMGNVSLGLEAVCSNALTEWSTMKTGFQNLSTVQYCICQNSLLITIMCWSTLTKLKG